MASYIGLMLDEPNIIVTVPSAHSNKLKSPLLLLIFELRSLDNILCEDRAEQGSPPALPSTAQPSQASGYGFLYRFEVG